jgi:pentatricopeptide repeat protein
MDKEIKQEIKRLMREGFSQQLAIITACANKGKPELAEEYLEEMADEQDEIKYALEKAGMVPFHLAYPAKLTITNEPIETPVAIETPKEEQPTEEIHIVVGNLEQVE